jgi:hypothetical protein
MARPRGRPLKEISTSVKRYNRYHPKVALTPEQLEVCPYGDANCTI